MVAPQFTPPLFCKAMSDIGSGEGGAERELSESLEEENAELQAVHNIQVAAIKNDDVIFFIISYLEYTIYL